MIRSAAVLGAGVLGSSTALHLARRGVAVTVFEQASAPFRGASRWNEGKIHLGFLYAGDPTFRTAQALLAAGLDFRDQVERLTGITLDEVTSRSDDHYLVQRNSLVAPEAAGAYFDGVAAMVAGSPDAHRYLADVSRCAAYRLGPAELETLADPSTTLAGFRVPERSVDTNAVADAFVAALHDETGIEMALEHRVTTVRAHGVTGEQWFVQADQGRYGPFDAVVNALWEGRPAVDDSVGHRPDTEHQHRYRVSVFAHTRDNVETPCAVLSVGAFGDVKNYNGRDFYLSWYPLGLLARAEAIDPPPVPAMTAGDRDRLAAAVFAELTARLPWVATIEQAADEIRVEGGWVYSQGHGRVDDPRAGVHSRRLFGISNVGTYYSVDTGKYSVAPTLADRLARSITHQHR